MTDSRDKLTSEFPWWLIKDLPWNVIRSSDAKELLFGFLCVVVTANSLPGWCDVYLVDTKAMRAVDTAFMLYADVKKVYLNGAEGSLSLEGSLPYKFLINTFISSWGSSSDKYEKYIAKLVNLKTICFELKKVVELVERMKEEGVLNELREKLTQYESEVELMINLYPLEYVSKWGSPRCVGDKLLTYIKGVR